MCSDIFFLTQIKNNWQIIYTYRYCIYRLCTACTSFLYYIIFRLYNICSACRRFRRVTIKKIIINCSDQFNSYYIGTNLYIYISNALTRTRASQTTIIIIRHDENWRTIRFNLYLWILFCLKRSDDCRNITKKNNNNQIPLIIIPTYTFKICFIHLIHYTHVGIYRANNIHNHNRHDITHINIDLNLFKNLLMRLFRRWKS